MVNVGVDPIYVLVVNGADATTKMYENSASMTYTDNDGDSSDSLTIKIAGYWDIVKFSDTAELWLGYASTNVWHVGTFTVQSVSVNAFETTIKATSANFNSEIKEKKTKVYKGWNVKVIVEEIAKKRNLQVKCDIDDTIEYIAQQDESDIHFLTRISKEMNALFKIKKDTIIFINRDTTNTHTIDIAECYDNGPTVTFNNRGEYKSATAEWHDSKTNAVKKIQIGSGTPVLKITESFESEAEATRVAGSKLKKESRGKVSGRLNIYGMDIVAGNKLEITGDKRFDDREFGITRVTHTVGDGGFVTVVEFES